VVVNLCSKPLFYKDRIPTQILCERFALFAASFVMAVISFQRAVLLFAAMGANQMDAVSLLLQPMDSFGFYVDARVV